MKKSIKLVGIVGLFATGLTCSSFVNAALIANIWQPVFGGDGTSTTVTVEGGPFAITDASNASTLNVESSDSNLIDVLTFYVKSGGTSWWVKSADFGTEIELGATPLFSVLERTQATAPTMVDALALGTNAWNITTSVGNSIYFDDISHVPLPPAVLLFGSALGGLIAVGRRRNKTPVMGA